MRRLLVLLPVLIAFQAGVQPALAWTWPAAGPVLRPFTLGDDPYAGGQHRGVDIAGETGTPIRAPAAGVVSFAGTVPGGGRAVTVQTATGYSVTLVHLGSIAVEQDQALSEGATVGVIGPTGDVEHLEPYVHLGIRLTSDPHGYLDPLSFLPPRVAPLPPAPPPPPADPVPAVPPVSAPQSPPPPLESPPPAPETPAPGSPESVGGEPASAPARAPLAAADAPVAAGPVPTAALDPPVTERPVLSAPPRRVLLSSFEPASVARGPANHLSAPGPAQPAASAPDPSQGAAALVAVIGVAAAATAAAAVSLRLRRHQLGDTRPAHAPPPVIDQRPRRAAEDARAGRSAQEDGLILHRDLEGVALEEPESLPDLDWDDDPAELVQVTDDACRRFRGAGATAPGLGRFHHVRPRVSARCGRAETVSAR